MTVSGLGGDAAVGPTARGGVAVSGASAATGGRAAAKTLNIGEVLDLLRADHPDVTLSKIRFLEAEGLVEPARTSSNYRKYSGADVARLRFILSAQRDRYLPLRVIRQQLEALDQGVEPSDAGGVLSVVSTSGATGPAVEVGALLASAGDPAEIRMSRRDMLGSAGLSEDQLAELERYGLLGPRPGGTYYDGDALQVALAVAELSRYGIEARHLRAFKAAADREVGLVEQVVTPIRHHRDAQARARAQEVTQELAALSLRLHAALVQAGLRAGSVGPAPR